MIISKFGFEKKKPLRSTKNQWKRKPSQVHLTESQWPHPSSHDSNIFRKDDRGLASKALINQRNQQDSQTDQKSSQIAFHNIMVIDSHDAGLKDSNTQSE